MLTIPHSKHQRVIKRQTQDPEDGLVVESRVVGKEHSISVTL